MRDPLENTLMPLARGRCPMLHGLAVFALSALPVSASTVVPLDLPAIADHAAQVIVGRVAHVRVEKVSRMEKGAGTFSDAPRSARAKRRLSEKGPTPFSLASVVTFEEVEYLKGELPGSAPTFELTVPGGRLGDLRMQVCCAPSFRVGDKWILCLLPTYKTFPVVGLYQGAYLVRRDEHGVERVYHRRHDTLEPIAGLDPNGFLRVAASARTPIHERLVAAHQVRLQPATRDSGIVVEAITYDAFVAALRPVLAASRVHVLTGPAGQPAEKGEPGEGKSGSVVSGAAAASQARVGGMPSSKMRDRISLRPNRSSVPRGEQRP